ncbi:MAG: response regulator [Deltaproteobacteria bacterium]|nr:response regulator [Deltaproteobacteria bacterium]
MPRVLLVEDNPIVLEVVRYTLAEAGYAVRGVSDGPSALAAAQEEEPSAVVLDLKLPGMDGREVLRKLKATHPRVPVFVFSGRGDSADVVAELAGVDGCFAKSADLSPLIRALGRAVR